jgi:hypothetical protein
MLVQRTAFDGSNLLTDGRSAARVERLKAGIILITVAGKGSVTIDKAILEVVEKEMNEHGNVKFFCDLRGVSRMASGTKEWAVPWGKEHKGRYEGNILVGSRIVEMTLTVITLLVGAPLRIHFSEEILVKALKAEVPGFHRLPKLDVPGVTHVAS